MDAVQLTNPFITFPRELGLKVCSYFTPKELAILSLVCKLFYDYCRDESIWKSFLKADYPHCKKKESYYLSYIEIKNTWKNVIYSRYSYQDITFHRRNSSQGSQWVDFSVMNNLLFAVTTRKTLEVWDLKTALKINDDIPLQGADPKEIVAYSKDYIKITFKNGIEFCSLKDKKTNYAHGSDVIFDFSSNAAVVILNNRYINAMVMSSKIEGESDVEADKDLRELGVVEIQDYYIDIDDNILYVLSKEGLLKRWCLASLNPLEDIDIKPDRPFPYKILFPNKILLVSKKEIIIQYLVPHRNVNGKYRSTLYTISWDLNLKSIIQEKEIQGISKNYLDCLALSSLVLFKYEEAFAVLDPIKMKVEGLIPFPSNIPTFKDATKSPFYSRFCLWKDTIYTLKNWNDKTGDYTLSCLDFSPTQEKASNEEQIILDEKKKKILEKFSLIQNLTTYSDKTRNTEDYCSSCLYAIGLAVIFGLKELSDYFWDRLNDLGDWISSFFESDDDRIIGINLAALPMTLAAGEGSGVPIPPEANDGI